MIEIEYFTGFTLYLGTALLGILGLWIWFEWKDKQQIQPIAIKEIHTCEYCANCYLALSLYRVSRCPHCQSFNKKSPS